MENENKKRHDLKHFCQTKLHKKRESSVSCSDKSDHCVSIPFVPSCILSITGKNTDIGHLPENGILLWFQTTECVSDSSEEATLKRKSQRRPRKNLVTLESLRVVHLWTSVGAFIDQCFAGGAREFKADTREYHDKVGNHFQNRFWSNLKIHKFKTNF